MRTRRALLMVTIGSVVALGGPAPGAGAATAPVNCPADDLQVAIDNATSGDILDIAGTCTDNFTIDKSLTLRGAPSATLQAPGSGRVITITGAPTVLLDRLTITGASLPGNGGGVLNNTGALTITDSTFIANDAGSGGGIYNAGGTVSVTSSTLSGNMGDGGGIYNDGGTVTVASSTLSGGTAGAYGGGIFNYSGTFTITGSTIAGNGAGIDGGGIYNEDTLAITNSTVSGNTADQHGGGIYNYTGSTTSESSTITDNTADADSAASGDAGGIFVDGGATTITNTILAGNHDPTSEPDCSGTMTSGGHNIVGVVSAGCTFTAATGDQSGTEANPLDARLGPLADNGGPTMTHALLGDSTAIGNAGPSSPPTDQRGAPRSSDIGAYELVFCGKVVVNRLGTEGDDSITGTDGPDGVLAFGGNDVISTGGGDDAVCAGEGNDTIDLGDGNDTVDAGNGDDVVIGGAGNDSATGGGGKDTIKGQKGNDTAKGGGGKDKLIGHGGKDVLKGQGGKDTLKGGGGNDKLNGGPGKDTCKPGGGKKDKLRGC